MDEVKVFQNKEFGELRMVFIDNEPWFVGKDIAEALGYEKARNAISAHVCEDDALKWGITDSLGRKQDTTVINESGIYALIFSSRLESAKRFKHWVTKEVLPSIRKNGGYIYNQEIMTPEQIVANALVVANNIIRERNKIIEEQRHRLKTQEPLVEFATHVSQTKDTIDMDEMAKIARDENIDIGRNRLIKWLKSKKILKDNNVPYQEYVNRGYFDVIEVKKETTYGTLVFPKTVITGKGQIWIVEKLREEYKK